MGEIIHLDTAEVKKQLGEMVLEAVEQTPNAMMDAERTKSRRRTSTSGQKSIPIHMRDIIIGNS